MNVKDLITILNGLSEKEKEAPLYVKQENMYRAIVKIHSSTGMGGTQENAPFYFIETK